ncbi:hypothetical protein MXMO3_01683 [Maritalea myrionectae]|uniref:Uncharacterized protein n=1 Tax=Maritalea myrionectae TaxID=454601 RepID=A0A2R4MEB7_9HYPH|nr:hypothetical protein [Maritalea myrionectae]AVX04209.1 hypothetical protein MXMO3_01683 [Maritalea myrionectae]
MVERGHKLAKRGKQKMVDGIKLRQQPPMPKNHVPKWVWYLAGAVSAIAILAAALFDFGVMA